MKPIRSEVKDDPTVMSEKLKEAAKAADMIITTGGVSVGKNIAAGRLRAS